LSKKKKNFKYIFLKIFSNYDIILPEEEKKKEIIEENIQPIMISFHVAT